MYIHVCVVFRFEDRQNGTDRGMKRNGTDHF